MKTRLFSGAFTLAIAVLFVALAPLIEAQTVQTICSFSNGVYLDGLTLGNDGNFYGSTGAGGSGGYGAVLKVATNGTVTMLYSFTNGVDGANPNAFLTLGNDGNFYGTTYNGGMTNSMFSQGMGTIFKVTTNGTLAPLAYFNFTNGVNGEQLNHEAALTLGNDGNFYGTTYYGGAGNGGFGYGTVFKVTTNGTLTAVYSFTNGPDGANPEAALTLGTDGNFYGTTRQGGTFGDGSVFKVTTNGILTSLYSFNAGLYNPVVPSGLTLGNDGNFYGTTMLNDTAFKMTTNGTLTPLATFDGDGTNGAYPNGLTLGNDGNFYGVTTFVGGGVVPTIFQLTTNGTLTTLYFFTNEVVPIELTLANDGSFYGATDIDGASGGNVFRLLLVPTITIQPQSQTNYAGAEVTFSVRATSPAISLYPKGYQWQKNNTNLNDGGNISGATKSTLIITGISDSDAGIYSVIVSNADASVSSSNATLTVNDSLIFEAQPLSQTVGAGSRVTFTAAVYGAPPFVFQWSFNRTPIGLPTTGTNSSVIMLTNVGTNQSGDYAVQVFNGSGSLTSSNAVLTVVPQPTLSLELLAGYPVLSLYGELGSGFIVQYSTNLAATNWVYLLSLTNLSTSPNQFLDPSGVGQPARFYRAYFAQ